MWQGRRRVDDVSVHRFLRPSRSHFRRPRAADSACALGCGCASRNSPHASTHGVQKPSALAVCSAMVPVHGGLCRVLVLDLRCRHQARPGVPPRYYPLRHPERLQRRDSGMVWRRPCVLVICHPYGAWVHLPHCVLAPPPVLRLASIHRVASVWFAFVCCFDFTVSSSCLCDQHW